MFPGKKIAFVFLFVVFTCTLVSAQNTDKELTLQGLIEADKTINRGTYIIASNVKVAKTATLKIKSGVKLLLKRGVSIKVEGGLLIEGNSNNEVEISSEDTQAEGLGIIIVAANHNKEVKIQFAKFHYLLIPISFENNWYRKSVLIENCVFENINTKESGIVIKNPDEIVSKDSINFIFRKNNFVANLSNMFIKDFESDINHIIFENNLVTGNDYYGFEVGGIANSPIHGSYDGNNRKYKAYFYGNSIYNNYLLHNERDTLLQEINFGIDGRGEKFVIASNFFGTRSPEEIQKTFDHFPNNPSAPYLEGAPFLAEPSVHCHGHIWKIYFQNSELANWNQLPVLSLSSKDTLLIRVLFNRSVRTKDGHASGKSKSTESISLMELYQQQADVKAEVVSYPFITYHYYNKGTSSIVDAVCSNVSIKWEAGDEALTFFVKDNIYLNNPGGYFTISGFRDNEGFDVPAIHPGKNQFLKTVPKEKLDQVN